MGQGSDGMRGWGWWGREPRAGASEAAPERLHGLDVLRVVAIGAVMLYHLRWCLPPVLEGVGGLGWMGVDLFFVLSGYLIGGQVLRMRGRGQGLGAFYRRRAWRILPAYLVVLLVYEVWPTWREQPGLPAAWKFLTFTANLWMNFPAERAFSHAWSLCVEEHFYLVLPLVVLWAMRRPGVGRTVALLVGVVVCGMLVRGWELLHVVRAAGEDDAGAMVMTRLYYPTYSRLDGLVMGVAVAVVEAFRPVWWAWAGRWATGVAVAGAALWAATTWMFGPDYVVPDATWGVVVGLPVMDLAMGLLVLSAATGRGVLRARVPGVGVVAAMAYSLYLTHKEVAHVDRAVFGWMAEDRGWGAAAVYGGTCLVAAAVLYLGVERPCLWLRDGRVRRRRVRAGVEARLDPAV